MDNPGLAGLGKSGFKVWGVGFAGQVSDEEGNNKQPNARRMTSTVVTRKTHVEFKIKGLEASRCVDPGMLN